MFTAIRSPGEDGDERNWHDSVRKQGGTRVRESTSLVRVIYQDLIVMTR